MSKIVPGADTLFKITLRWSFQLILAVFLLTTHAGAQTILRTTSALDGTTPLALTPEAPAGSYALSGFDHINPYNGHLNFRLPLHQVIGRGEATMTMMLAIEQIWNVNHHIVQNPDGSYSEVYDPNFNWWAGLKPGYGPGVMQARSEITSQGVVLCPPYSDSIWITTLTRLTFSAPDGAEYELVDKATGGEPKRIIYPCDPPVSRGRVFVTADGSAATFIADAPGIQDPYTTDLWPGQYPVSGVLLLQDGTRYRIDNGLVTEQRDRNGNILTFSYDMTMGYNRVTSIKDSLNRQVMINYSVNDVAPYGLCDQIVFKGFGSAMRTVRVSYGTLDSLLRPGSNYTIQTLAALFPQLPNTSSSSNFIPGRISSVWLPGDGVNYKRYQFFYNPYGELARVVLPTGRAIEYDYDKGKVGGWPGGKCPART